ncbi:MAG: cytochrome c oxidase accessory protein CcoG [Candidatus Kapabacteria bacterium]|nr:cytochrome c oxidase accessory protein CcoG [Candidatus Kapabacteria bacterium]
MSLLDIGEVEDHERFRAELGSIRPDGRRKWIYARKPRGKFTNWRTILSWFLLAFLMLAPFVKVGGHQFLLLNIIKREFVLFGMPFWPNDFYLVALLFLTGVITIVVFTATLGRIWCGWLCPQTIFLEMVFRKIEWLIEGGPKEQAQRHAGPWNWDRTWRSTLKIVVFAAISFLIANVFLSYIISSDELLQYVRNGPLAHIELFGGLVFFTFVFFMVFYRFREQACLIACPYGRFMSALVDENTVSITYDYKRGEDRAKWTKADNDAKKTATVGSTTFSRPESKGDCVDCHQCVTVCPTGIDIRNGIQLECVSCTACIDACDEVMDKVGLEKGLIRYSSQEAIETGRTTFFTRRIKAYLAVWLVMISVVVTLFAIRHDLDVVVLRQEGTTWVIMKEEVANFYRLQIINKTGHDIPYEIHVTSPHGFVIKDLGMPSHVKPGDILKGRFIIVREKDAPQVNESKLTLQLTTNGEVFHVVTTSFIAP